MATVASAEALRARKVRIVFSAAMRPDAALESPVNYGFEPAAGGTPVYVVSAKPQNDTAPLFVDLVVTEMTHGIAYTVRATGIRDLATGELIGSPNSASITGIGGAPGIKLLRAISKNRVDVLFDEEMLDEADLRDPTRFVWDNGLETLAVLSIKGNVVSLATTDQQPETLYTLVVGGEDGQPFLMIATNETTSQASFEVIGGISLDGDDYSAVELVTVGFVSSGDLTGEVILYNVTDDVLVGTNTYLGTTSPQPRNTAVTLASGTKLYEIRHRVTGGLNVSDILTIYWAGLKLTT
jgi:hypothetical protein